MASFMSVYEESLTGLRASGNLELFMEEFKALTDNLSRVQMVQSQEWLPNFILTSSNQPKNNIRAQKFLEQAQRQVKTGNSKEALDLLNRAVQLAAHPKPSEPASPGSSIQCFDVLCRAYALRSKNFFHMHHFHCAALDAQRSLCLTNHQYAPAQVQTMTVLMKSLRHIGKQQEAETLLSHYFDNAPTGSLDDVTKDELEEAAFAESLGSYEDARCFPLTQPSPPKVSYGPHEVSASLTSAVDLTYCADGKGRRMVANRDINVGDVIIVDPAFCLSLKPEHFATHCLNCVVRLEAPVPCYECSSVFFCSERCRDAAWQSIHSAECSHLDALTADHIGCMAFLAYRAAIAAGITNLLKAPDVPSSSCFWNEENELTKLTGLEQHDSDRPVGDLLKRTLTAIYLESCLEFSPSFPQQLTSDDKDRLTASILGFLQSLSCNAYEIAETVVKKGDIKNAESIQLGGAVFPVVSMTNHSCSPNVMRVSYATTCVVRVVKPIRKGEEVLDNYGFFYHLNGRIERQDRLRRQYFFMCQCIPCSRDWPTIEDVQPAACKFFCPTCKVTFSSSAGSKCSVCSKDVDVQRQQKRWEDIKGQLFSMGKSVLSGKLEGVVPKLGLLISLLDRLAEEPSKESLEACLLLKQCLNLEGNMHWIDISPNK